MINRYTLPEMGKIWKDQNKFQKWLDVELAVIKIREEKGEFPKGTYKLIKNSTSFTVEKVKEIEKETRHDLVAFIKTLQQSLSKESKNFGSYIHRNITSYDTEEPALALLLFVSLDLILKEAKELKKFLLKKAQEYRFMKFEARTHGKPAQISIFGLNFLVWTDMLQFCIKKMGQSKKDIAIGKLSGAVGRYNRSISPELEKQVMNELGLDVPKISTQIIQRHRIASMVSNLGITASVAGDICWNIWLLVHRGLVDEPFEKGQTGSSVMAHKKNPVTCERIIGLSRSVRKKVESAQENIFSAEQRDISHSSVERIDMIDALILTYYILRKTTYVINGIRIYPKRIAREIKDYHNLYFSEQVKTFLEEKGIDPEEAYTIIQKACFKAEEKEIDLDKILLKDKKLIKLLPEIKKTPKEFTDLFNEDLDLIHVSEIYKRFGL